jgi:hypothetical protein
VWENVFSRLTVDADNEYTMIDNTIVRAVRTAPAHLKKTKMKRSDAAKAA